MEAAGIVVHRILLPPPFSRRLVVFALNRVGSRGEIDARGDGDSDGRWFCRRPSHSRNDHRERKGSAVLLDALIVNKGPSAAAVVMSDAGQVATIVVQQPSVSGNSPDQQLLLLPGDAGDGTTDGRHAGPVDLPPPVDLLNRWPDFANSLLGSQQQQQQQYHDFQAK